MGGPLDAVCDHLRCRVHLQNRREPRRLAQRYARLEPGGRHPLAPLRVARHRYRAWVMSAGIRVQGSGSGVEG